MPTRYGPVSVNHQTNAVAYATGSDTGGRPVAVNPVSGVLTYPSGSDGDRPIAVNPVSGALTYSSTVFTPASISDLVLWVDASQITGLADGAAVATWSDLSGNSRNLTQATGANQPTYQTGELNSLPVVRFDGTDDWVRCDAATWGAELAQPNTILVVASSAGSGTEVIMDGPGGAGRHLIYNGGGGEVAFFGGAQVNVTETFPLAHTLLNWEVNGASSVMRKNGAAYGSGACGSQGMGGLTVGADQGGNSRVEGDVAELLVYDRSLTNTERDALEAYLLAKWLP